ncbi:MAG: replication-associated recombination protein A [Rickettsiales bacterium]|nr:replication-associated recombination protein A [Rickettsiales bacterium]
MTPRKKTAPQDSLFAAAASTPPPLPEQLRPKHLREVIGQEHLTGEAGILSRMVAARHLQSVILWGPPGCGKTTIARLLAVEAGYAFEQVSAVASGVADLKKHFELAAARQQTGQRTALFIDEVHRFNRAQQDVLLPVIEDGTITLIGATTENPSFELNSALLSRCRVLVLNRLSPSALEQLLVRAEQYLGLESRVESRESSKLYSLPLTPEAREALIAMADGDGRYLLTMVEAVWDSGVRNQKSEVGSEESATGPGSPSWGEQKNLLDVAALAALLQRRPPVYDKAQESHYNLISALHKSLRGSDVDAALYWFCRMLNGGEDPLYIARRLIRFASEDIGMADPQALTQALDATAAYERLGSPEGELAIAQAVIYLATAPKSNAQYVAFKAATRSADEHGSLMPPAHILNAPTKLMKELGYGAGYAYDHNTAEGFSGQNYFPDGMAREQFYMPVERGFEREILKRLEYWQKLREKRG